jgi:membrane protease YdiL (CAAX protease family)
MRPLLAIRLPSKHDLVVIGQTFAAILLIKFAYGWLLVALHHGRHTQNGWAHFRVYDTTEFLGVLFVSCLVAPVVEEFAFRGFLFNALVIRMPLVAAVLLDGVIFGLVHLDAVFFVPLALFGSLQALAYWRTKNLLVPITLHSLNNGLALAFALLAHHHRG